MPMPRRTPPPSPSSPRRSPRPLRPAPPCSLPTAWSRGMSAGSARMWAAPRLAQAVADQRRVDVGDLLAGPRPRRSPPPAPRGSRRGPAARPPRPAARAAAGPSPPPGLELRALAAWRGLGGSRAARRRRAAWPWRGCPATSGARSSRRAVGRGAVTAVGGVAGVGGRRLARAGRPVRRPRGTARRPMGRPTGWQAGTGSASAVAPRGVGIAPASMSVSVSRGRGTSARTAEVPGRWTHVDRIEASRKAQVHVAVIRRSVEPDGPSGSACPRAQSFGRFRRLGRRACLRLLLAAASASLSLRAERAGRWSRPT